MGAKGSSPEAPNYDKLIPQQEASNLRQFNTVLGASRPTTYTPTGTTSWTRTPGEVNRSAYESALAAYRDRQNAIGAAVTTDQGMDAGNDGSGMAAPTRFQGTALTEIGDLPTEDQFRSPDSWAMQQTLSPGEQGVFDSDQRNRQSAADRSGELIAGLDTSALDTSSLPQGYSQDPARLQAIGDAIFNAGKRYVQPGRDQQNRSLREDLLSQGFNFTDAAVQDPMDRLRRTQDLQDAQLADTATLASRGEDTRLFNQAEGLRSNRLAEMLTQRRLPLDMLSALRGGGQPQPVGGAATYTAPSLQGIDRIGLADQTYGHELDASNAEAANSSGFLQGLLRLVGTGVGAAYGGPVGAAAGGALAGGIR